MSNLIGSNKKPSNNRKSSGRFSTARDAAKAKNADLLKQIKQAGLTITTKKS